MADTCLCSPTTLQQCNPITAGSGVGYISVPMCQIIPTGDSVSNPFFDTGLNTSYYTYQITNPCDGPTELNAVSISLCASLPIENISVAARIGSCPDFTDLTALIDNTVNPPPEGFNSLTINLDNNVAPGTCAIIRLALIGNYPVSTVNSNIAYITPDETTFSNFGWIIPGCPVIPRLTVNKQCVIDNETSNDLQILYTVDVSNTGNVTLTNIAFTDLISYPTNVTIFDVIVPEGITVDLTTPNLIRLTGTFDQLEPGEDIRLNYTVIVASFGAPGVFSFINTATAQSGDVSAASMCTATVNVFAFQGELCCLFSESGSTGNTASFEFRTINVAGSPSTDVVTTSSLATTGGLQILFLSFGGCTAVFSGTNTPVPLNEVLTAPMVTLTCGGTLPENGTLTTEVTFRFISSNFGGGSITATFNSIELADPTVGRLLPVDTLPLSRTVSISYDSACQNPCTPTTVPELNSLQGGGNCGM